MSKYWQQRLLDDEDIEGFSKVMEKKYGKRKQNNKQGGKPSRCPLTVDFVEEQTGDKYTKTKLPKY